jgi:murein DD-endopeptidase MepM/ murein hydrolase activator NlpD
VRVVAVITALGVAATVLVSAVPAAASQADLERAQKAANQAAAEYAAAETRLSGIESDILGLKAKQAATAAQLDSLTAALRGAAIDQYVRGRNAGPDAEFGLDLAATSRRTTLASYVTKDAGDTVDQFRLLSADLAAAEKLLADRQREAATVTGQMKTRIAAAQIELGKLQKLEVDRKAKEEAQRRAELAADAAAARSASPTVIRVPGSWLCPVQGPVAFTDSFGAPRGGGRRKHQGVDMMSPRGTPVVASVSGAVRRSDNGAGGIAYYLEGDDGNVYYGAHLQSYVGGTGSVEQGTVVGYVGNTGDAAGGPTHLHFEIHPGGGAAVNPTGTVSQHC